MRVGPTLDKILKEYPDQVRIVYKQHPLPMHTHAAMAAEAARAAHAQGKYFPMQEKLFGNMATLSPDKIREVAAEVGLDMSRFQQDLDSHKHQAVVDSETREVMAIGATGTPASFVNGRYLSGAQPFEAFKAIIDEELKWAKDGNRPAFTSGTSVRDATPVRSQRPQGPDPAKSYALSAGNAPFVGPANARITILHYLDYQ